jgi:hypothetical protein
MTAYQSYKLYALHGYTNALTRTAHSRAANAIKQCNIAYIVALSMQHANVKTTSMNVFKWQSWVHKQTYTTIVE